MPTRQVVESATGCVCSIGTRICQRRGNAINDRTIRQCSRSARHFAMLDQQYGATRDSEGYAHQTARVVEQSKHRRPLYLTQRPLRATRFQQRDYYRRRPRGVQRWHVSDRSQIPIGRIAVAVRTAPRQVPTLQHTLDALTRAGFESPRIFAEPDTELDDDIDAKFWPKQYGNRRAMVESCRHVLNNDSAQWILLLEDDAALVPGVADYLRTQSVAGHLVSLYRCEYRAPASDLGDGAGFFVDNRRLQGSLALFAHREEWERVLPHISLRERFAPDYGLEPACRHAGVEWLVPSESLVAHVGAYSAVNPQRWNHHAGKRRHVDRYESSTPTTATPQGVVTLVTPTGDRPEQFRLLQRWIAQQRYCGPIQWIVVDDGETPQTPCGTTYIRREPKPDDPRHTLTANLRAALPHIRGDYVLILEDDEYYAPDYVSMMVGALHHGDMAGQQGSRYYWLRHRKFRHGVRESWVSLCRTGFRRSVLPAFQRAIESDHPSVDLRLWSTHTGSRKTWRSRETLNVGFKDGPGRGGNRQPSGDAAADTDLQTLKRWCPDWQAYLPWLGETQHTEPKRHLTYFVYPRSSNDMWRWNCNQLRERIELFNGHRVILIATDETTDTAEDVRRYLSIDAEYLERPNHRTLHEAAWWPTQLDAVAPYCGAGDVVFSAHAKGISKPREPVRLWAQTMYEACLDFWPLVAEALQTHTTAGPFRRRGVTPQMPGSSWHYSGTFFWWRAGDMMSRAGWNNPASTKWAQEGWPGRLTELAESACLFGEDVTWQASCGLYSASTWRTLRPAWDEWKRNATRHRTPEHAAIV